jgi:hypothetical protein
MSAITEDKLRQMGITRDQAIARGLLPKNFAEQQQRIEKSMENAKYLNLINSPEYRAEQAYKDKLYKEKQAGFNVEMKKKDDKGQEIKERTFGEDFVRGMERFIDDFDSAMEYIQYVPILNVAGAASSAIGRGIVETSKGNVVEGLEQLGRGAAKIADVIIAPGASKAYDAAVATAKTVADLADGEFDIGKLTDIGTNIASIATGSDVGKKLLSGVETEAKKVLSDTAQKMIDHAQKQGLTQVSDMARQLVGQAMG